MKKMLILIALAVVALPALAQKPEYDFNPQKRLPEYEFKLPDSLSHMTPWRPSEEQSMQSVIHPVVSMTSVVVLQGRKPLKHVTVTERNVLQAPHVTVSNGQAWNWGSYPNSYLDARTIIMPSSR